MDIVDIAVSFVGMKEISGNLGFRDERFQALMEECGWEKGQAWCSYFCELVWKLTYKDEQPLVFKMIDKLFSAGAVNTYNNFKESGWFVVDKKPEPGAVVIWQTWKKGRPHWTGHAGIVERIKNEKEIETIEGNTNSEGGREGIEVARKVRL